ncbi:MAG: SDR family oxidoreductase [Deltaproteobacteria bacterium]|nr:SDR family oxidoreductase [Deltaproteobacteria bacterium]
MDISNKVAIVTGAARGIGRATAVALGKAGARAVVLADQRQSLSEETAALVRAQGAEALALETDVSDLDSLRRLIQETEERFGGLHILHNNAGIGEGTYLWPDVPSERAAAIIDVNLRGVILGTQLALEPMKRSGGGAIVSTSSGGAFVPLPPQAVYAATKAAVVHFTKSCVPLLESHGVRVSCVCPGVVSTDMVQETGTDGPAPWLQAVIDGLEVLAPEDIAAKVLELIRDPESAGEIAIVANEPRKAS